MSNIIFYNSNNNNNNNNNCSKKNSSFEHQINVKLSVSADVTCESLLTHALI
jgi:hypothetical protein